LRRFTETPYNSQKRSQAEEEMISFIVPAYNEELELSSTIASIHGAAAGASHEAYEIIVVDDGSTDATADFASQAGARVISINRRQIAAARNAGARAAHGEYLFFVDADTRINRTHSAEGIAALEAGYAGGSARVMTDGFIPLWGRIFVRAFCALYFGFNLGAGAFLFTTRCNFDIIGGFDEQYFVGEEVCFSLALRKLGRFKVLREPILTSGRKLRMYSAQQVLGRSFAIIIRGPRAARSRDKLDFWYDGRREKRLS
jgi:glycosyltransferase involved in cell wall biosynthesis